MHVYYPQDPPVQNPVTLGSLVIFAKYEREEKMAEIQRCLKMSVTISLCYLPFLPQSQPTEYSNKKMLTIPLTVGHSQESP